MKKHKRKKFIKRMRFVFRRRRQLKENRKENEIQKYEREQVKLGQLYSAEQYVDEQLALARKSGWHIDIIAEFNRERQKERAATAATSAAAGSSDGNSKHWLRLRLFNMPHVNILWSLFLLTFVFNENKYHKLIKNICQFCALANL